MISTNGNHTKTVTLPWGKDKTMPRENLIDETEVRASIDKVERLAMDHVGTRHSEMGGWSQDLDPDLTRVLRRKESDGVTHVTAVKTQEPQTENYAKGALVSYDFQSSNGSDSVSAEWRDGAIYRLEDTRRDESGGISYTSLQVNENGTLTYTSSKPSEDKES